jgi:hypothetical protein
MEAHAQCERVWDAVFRKVVSNEVMAELRHAALFLDAWRAELGPQLGLASADRIAELQTAITVRDTEIARLETDLELARRDAERYRWIRDSDNEGPISAGNATAFGEYGFERVEWFYDDELDAAVDEARAAMGVGDAIGLLPH